ncbi:MAG: hypothetical protein QOJ29_1999 [Thermoleophilaceae bacterium]|nr:hypothetical protein [Thermoleophilaceae bacterium]
MRSTLRRRLRRWRRSGVRPSRGRWKPGIAVSLLALVASAPAGAAPSWDPPRELSDAGSTPLNLAATAGLSPNGGAVVLWHSAEGVQAVVRAAGHGFGTAHAISGSDLSMPDLRPSLAFDGTGAALAVWSYFEPHPRFVEDGYAVDYTFGLRVASRGASGAFGRAQTLTDKLDADPSADVAFDPSGNAVVIWTDEAGMHAAARTAGKRRFGRAQIISQTQADPQVTVGSTGDATAAWAGTGSVRASSADGMAFGSAVTLKIPGLGKAKPVIGVDGRSAVTAAWADRGRVMAATCRASGRCGQATALSPSGETATDPRVAVAADGTAVIAWRSVAGISASLRHGHSRFGRPGRLGALDKEQTATDLSVAVGPGGDAAALWTVHTPDGDGVQAALRHGAHARFSTASALTPPVPGAHWSKPQIVLDASGNALAVWGAMIDGHPSVQGATFDVG